MRWRSYDFLFFNQSNFNLSINNLQIDFRSPVLIQALFNSGFYLFVDFDFQAYTTLFILVSPPPSCGRKRRICCLFQQSGPVFIAPTSENVSLYSGTGGRLCSPNLRIWNPVLSIELHPYIYRLFDGTIRVGSGFPGACLPHGGCDPPARIVGWYDLRYMVPGQDAGGDTQAGGGEWKSGDSRYLFCLGARRHRMENA